MTINYHFKGYLEFMFCLETVLLVYTTSVSKTNKKFIKSEDKAYQIANFPQTGAATAKDRNEPHNGKSPFTKSNILVTQFS